VRSSPQSSWGTRYTRRSKVASPPPTPLYRFELFSEAGGEVEDTFQVKGREEARHYVRSLDAFEGEGRMRIYVAASQDWREISRTCLMSD